MIGVYPGSMGATWVYNDGGRARLLRRLSGGAESAASRRRTTATSSGPTGMNACKRRVTTPQRRKWRNIRQKMLPMRPEWTGRPRALCDHMHISRHEAAERRRIWLWGATAHNP